MEREEVGPSTSAGDLNHSTHGLCCWIWAEEGLTTQNTMSEAEPLETNDSMVSERGN